MKMGTGATPYFPFLKGESCVLGSGVYWMKMGTDITHSRKGASGLECRWGPTKAPGLYLLLPTPPRLGEWASYGWALGWCPGFIPRSYLATRGEKLCCRWGPTKVPGRQCCLFHQPWLGNGGCREWGPSKAPGSATSLPPDPPPLPSQIRDFS